MNPSFDHQLLSRHAYGLVEPSMVEYLPEDIATISITPSELSASEHLMPRLLALRSLSENQQATLLSMLSDAQHYGEQPVVVMLLQTALSADEFVCHWNRLQMAMSGAGRKVWLRLHDSRVLHQILRILPPQQQRKLFDKVDSISYWLGDRWITANAKSTAGQSAVGTPLYLNWDWSRIEQIGTVNRALQAAGVRQATEISVKAELAEQLIARAKEKHGFTEQADLVEFAMRGLTTAVAFDEHPGILEAIRASIAHGDASLCDRLALIDEKVWGEVSPNIPVEHEKA